MTTFVRILTIFVTGERFDFIGFFAFAGRNRLILLVAIFVIFAGLRVLGFCNFRCFIKGLYFFCAVGTVVAYV